MLIREDRKSQRKQWCNLGALNSFPDTKTPTRWEKLTAGCPTPTSTPLQIDWNRKVNEVDIHLPPHQPFRTMFMSWSRPFWIKLLTSPSRSGHILKALACCGPLAWQSSKAVSYFTQSSPSLRLRVSGFVCVSHSVMSDSAIPHTLAHQAPLSMKFSRQEYCSGLQFSSPKSLNLPSFSGAHSSGSESYKR